MFNEGAFGERGARPTPARKADRPVGWVTSSATGCDVRELPTLSWFRRWWLLAPFVMAAGLLASAASRHHAPPRHSRDWVLNGLRDDINAHYGYLDGVPRVNRGPCGRFARAFREQWNARFRAKVHIAFVMPNDGGECCH